MRDTKKILLTLMFALCAAVLAAGCGGGGGEDTQEGGGTGQDSGGTGQQSSGSSGDYADVDPEGQTVTFWHIHTQEREEALQQIIDDYNASNEHGITVEAEYQGDYGEMFNKMLPLLNTDEVPSAVLAYQNQAATYQLGDALVDMRPLVDSEEWGLTEEEQDDFFEAFFQQDLFPTFDDARLGFPPNRSIEVIYYNQEWLEELGYDGPPENPEEFREMACAASEAPFSGSTADGGSVGFPFGNDASNIASLTYALGGDIFDSEAGEYTYDNEATVEAAGLLQGMFEDGCAELVTEDFGDQTDFGAGRALFTMGSTSGLPFYESAVEEGAGFEFDVAPVPYTTSEPQVNVYGSSASIPRTSPEEELAAWLFLKHFSSPEVQAEWAQESNYFPVRESAAEDLQPYFEENPTYESGFELLEYGRSEPPVPGYDFVRDQVEETMAAVVEGAEVQSSLEDLNQEANDILEEQQAQQ